MPVVHQPVHVRGAHLTGVSPGLKVLGVFAVSMKESNGPGLEGHVIGGAAEPDVFSKYRHLVLHPAHDAILQPDGKPFDWYLVAIVEGTRRGEFKATGVSVDYEAGGHDGTEAYTFVIDLTCPGPPATPLPSPVQLPPD